jgi:hypothetical protein
LKPYRGPPMTLGTAAATQVRLIVWCTACQHQVEPDPAETAGYKFTWAAVLWPTCGKTGPVPQVEAPESGRNPRKFHTAVWDLVGRTETRADAVAGYGLPQPPWGSRHSAYGYQSAPQSP